MGQSINEMMVRVQEIKLKAFISLMEQGGNCAQSLEIMMQCEREYKSLLILKTNNNE